MLHAVAGVGFPGGKDCSSRRRNFPIGKFLEGAIRFFPGGRFSPLRRLGATHHWRQGPPTYVHPPFAGQDCELPDRRDARQMERLAQLVSAHAEVRSMRVACPTEAPFLFAARARAWNPLGG